MDPNFHFFQHMVGRRGLPGGGGRARGGPLAVFPLAIIASYDLHVAGLLALVRGDRTMPCPSHPIASCMGALSLLRQPTLPGTYPGTPYLFPTAVCGLHIPLDTSYNT